MSLETDANGKLTGSELWQTMAEAYFLDKRNLWRPCKQVARSLTTNKAFRNMRRCLDEGNRPCTGFLHSPYF